MVRFGIVGFGLHAVKRLMPGFALSKNCKVTALSRRDMAQAQAIGAASMKFRWPSIRSRSCAAHLKWTRYW